MKNVSAKIVKAAELLFGFVGLIMIMIASYGVLARNVLQTPVPWTDEALKLMFVWAIFVVGALGFLSNDLISLTLVEDSFKEKGKKVIYNAIKIIQYLVAIAVNAALCSQLMTIISTQISTGETTTVIQYPLWILNVGMLVGSALIVVMGVFKIIESIKDMK